MKSKHKNEEINMELLTVEEVAGMLRVDPRSIYRQVENNDIPGWFRLKNGTGAIRFIKAKVMEWIESQTAQPKQ